MSEALICPACNKASQAGPACERCGCDLSQLHRVLAAAAASLGAACRCLKAQEWSEALAYAQQSWELCHSAEAADLAFVTAGALGETADALRWRQRAWAHQDRGA